jgi:hypothetical protein
VRTHAEIEGYCVSGLKSYTTNISREGVRIVRNGIDRFALVSLVDLGGEVRGDAMFNEKSKDAIEFSLRGESAL